MMSKKEQAEVAMLRHKLEVLAALRWTEAVEPDLYPPTAGSGPLSKGFLFSEYDPRVVPACSSSIGHNFGDDHKTTTQGARVLFSTRLRALRALRHAVELEAANKLARVDAQIAAELSKQESQP